MMELRNGKFYEGATVVPLEFGNKEQIRLMRLAKELVDAFNGDGLEVEHDVEEIISYRPSIHFKCICGSHVYKEGYENDDAKDIEGLPGHCACRKCKQAYDISWDKKEKVLKVKIAPKT